MRLFDFSRFLIMLAAVLQTTLYAQDGKSDRGAFILISTSGDVQYLKSNGQNKSAIKVGCCYTNKPYNQDGCRWKTCWLVE